MKTGYPLALIPLAFVAIVTGTTAAVQAGLVSSQSLASSPRRLAEGRFWLLVSNGTVVQRPIVLSLVAFAILSLLAAAVCGWRVYLAAAVAGHVGSTLLAYALLGAVDAADPSAGHRLLDAPDFGVSAIQAAWIGALAAVAWRHPGRTVRGRVVIVLACLAIAAFAWAVRSDLTLLDSDHLFAFAIGAVLGARLGTGRQSRPLRAAQRGAVRELASRRRASA